MAVPEGLGGSRGHLPHGCSRMGEPKDTSSRMGDVRMDTGGGLGTPALSCSDPVVPELQSCWPESSKRPKPGPHPGEAGESRAPAQHRPGAPKGKWLLGLGVQRPSRRGLQLKAGLARLGWGLRGRAPRFPATTADGAAVSSRPRWETATESRGFEAGERAQQGEAELRAATS